MKNTTLVGLTMMAVYLFSCSTIKTPEYQFTEGTLEKYKPFLIQRFEEGKILYRSDCTKCHDKNVVKKDGTPRFTSEQLEDYVIRISNKSHSENMQAKDLSDEDLATILFYIRHAKK